MTPLSELVKQLYNTNNPVTKCVLKEMIEKRILRGEGGRVD